MCLSLVLIQLNNAEGLVVIATPKAFANFSPGLERSDNPGKAATTIVWNPERVNPAHA
jgi:hypothetical protein